MKGEREGEGKGEGWGWVKIRVRVRVPPVLLHLALEASQLDLDPTLLAGEALAQKEARLATVAAPDRGGRSETRPSSLLGLAWRVTSPRAGRGGGGGGGGGGEASKRK